MILIHLCECIEILQAKELHWECEIMKLKNGLRVSVTQHKHYWDLDAKLNRITQSYNTSLDTIEYPIVSNTIGY
jgi:hypothetical protein